MKYNKDSIGLRLSWFAISYFLVFKFSEYIHFEFGRILSIWLTDAVTVIFLISNKKKHWWKILVIQFIIHYCLSLHDFTYLTCSIVTIANTTSSFLIAFLIRWYYKWLFDIKKLPNFLYFLLITAIGSLIGGIIGSLALYLTFPELSYTYLLSVWFMAYFTGSAVFIPFILLWKSEINNLKKLLTVKDVQKPILLFLLALVVYFIYSANIKNRNYFAYTFYLAIPIIFWIAYRFKPHLFSLVIVTMSLIIILFTNNEHGAFFFSNDSVFDSNMALQMFILVAFIPGYIFSTIISERDTLEHFVRSSEQLFRGTFEQAAVGIAHVRTDGVVVRVNQKFCDLLGYNKRDLLGKTFVDITYPDDITKDTNLFKQILDGEINSYDIEKRYIKANGEIIWGNLWLSAVKDNEGKIAYLVGAAQDITQNKNNQLEIHKLNTKLESRVEERTKELQNTLKELNTREHELKESQKRLNILYSTMKQGVIYQNSKGEIISANPAAERILGLSFKQMVGAKSFDIIENTVYEDGTHFPGEFHPATLAIKEKKPIRDVIMGVYHPDQKNYRWIIINSYPQINDETDAIELVYTSFEDITVRKSYEDALVKNEEKFRLQYKNLPIPAITFLFLKDDFKVIDCNNEYEKYSGEKVKSLNGKSYMEIYQGQVQIQKDIRECYTKQKSIRRELLIKRSDGSRKYLNITYGFAPQHYVMVHIEDLTGLKQAEQEKQLFFDVSLDMICIASSDGYFKRLSPTWSETLGWTDEELMSRPYIEFVHPDDYDDTISVEKDLSKGHNVVDFINRYRTKKGDYIWLSWRSVLVTELNLIFAVARNIQDIKETEAELKKYAHVQSELLREVNHRVKNNLAAMISILHIEQDKAQENAECDYYDLLRDLIGRISGLSTVHSMLSASNWQPINLKDLFKQIINASLKSLPQDILKEININETNFKIESDQAHQLAMVINELTTNSVKHGISNSKTLKIDIIFKETEENVIIVYKDGGKGYPDEIIKGDYSNVNIGFELITGIVSHSLSGEVIFRNNSGAQAEISINKEYIF